MFCEQGVTISVHSLDFRDMLVCKTSSQNSSEQYSLGIDESSEYSVISVGTKAELADPLFRSLLYGTRIGCDVRTGKFESCTL